MHGLEGLTIEISDGCNGCGTCVENCFAYAMKMHNGRAYVDFVACKGCGICAEKCPEDAIKIKVDDGNKMLQEAFKRLEACGDVT
jgi:UDP-glucose 4-epimerase